MAADELAGLFRRYRDSGDLAALARVFDAVAPELLAIARYVRPGEADDLVQSTFLTAIERAATYDPERRVQPWLVGILVNHARSARRRGSRALPMEEVEPSAPREAPAVEGDEIAERVRAALERLPATYRDVLEPHLREELAPKEIAARLGRPAGTVRSQLHRGLTMLRRVLPAGLASSAWLVGLFQPRELRAVRRRVLEHARRGAGPAPSGAPGGSAASVVTPGRVALLALAAGAASLPLLLRDEAPAPDALDGSPPGVAAQLERSAAASARAAERSAAARAGAAREPEGAPPSAVPRGDLQVVVRWSDGAPAADVGLRVVASNERRYAERIRYALTGADGTVLVEDVAAGVSRVFLDRGGFSRARVKADTTATIELEIPAGVHLFGTVVDRGGAPAADAGIWLSWTASPLQGHVVTRTDAQGRFALRDLDPRRFVAALADARAPSDMLWLGTPGLGRGERAELLLVVGDAPARLTGRVLDPRGLPLPGAGVRVSPRDPTRLVLHADGTVHLPAPPRELLSDDAGWFALEDLAPGPTRISVRAEGHAVLTRDLELAPGENDAVELRASPGAVLTGHVLAAEGGAAPFAHVRVLGPSLYSLPEVVADPRDGAFELDGLPPDGALVMTTASHKDRLLAALHRLPPGPGPHEWTATLPRAAALAGRLVDAAGLPLKGWWVKVRPLAEARSPATLAEWLAGSIPPDGATLLDYVSTDAEGRFEVVDCLPGPQLVEAHAFDDRARLPDAWARGAVAGGAPVELALSEPPAARGTLTGFVQDEHGLPQPGALVQCLHAELYGHRRDYAAAEDGAFRVERLPPGPITVIVWPPDAPPRVALRTELDEGEERHLGALRAASPGSLRARVAAPEGAAALAARLTDAEGQEHALEAGAAGELRAPALPPGDYVLSLAAAGCARARVALVVRAGEASDVDVQLEPGVPLRVLLRAPPDDAVRSPARVEVRDEEGALAWVEEARDDWSRDGAGLDLLLAPGRWRVSAEAGPLRGERRVELRADAGAPPRDVLVELAPRPVEAVAPLAPR